MTVQLEELELAQWRDALPDRGYSPFHTPEALKAIDQHTAAETRLFAGFKGQQPVALLPMFIEERSIGRLALSPPLGLGIRRLGPILMPVSPKRSKREKINNEFAERVIGAVDADATTTLFWVSCETEFRDPRPYQWAGFGVEPQYTYRLNLDSNTREEVMSSFSKSLRREIRDGEEEAVTVRTGGREDVQRVFEITKERYEEQGEPFDPSLGFVLDLFESLADRARVYVAETECGEFLSGMIVLYSADTAYFWKGGTRRSDHDASANSLLHWNAIEDVFEDPSFESVATYDFSTANNRGIVRYKRKFGGHLTPYYRIESAGAPMAVAKRAYRLKRELLP